MTFARTLRVDDSGPLQLIAVQGLIGELRDDCPRIGEWGIASNPPLSSQAVVVALGADRGQLVVIGVEDRNTRRKNIPGGAIEIYSSHASARIRIDAAGVISIDGSAVNGTTGPVTLNVTGNIAITATGTADITATGAATVNGSAVTVNAAGAATVNAGGAATIAAGSVSISGSTVIDGKNFLAHTHNVVAVGSPTGGVN